MEEQTSSDSILIIADIPEEAGYYQLGTKFQFRIMISPKPKWLARVMSKWLLGWIWVDAKIDK